MAAPAGRAGLADLVAAIGGDTGPSIPPADAWASLATVLAAGESAATGAATRPASLPLVTPGGDR